MYFSVGSRMPKATQVTSLAICLILKKKKKKDGPNNYNRLYIPKALASKPKQTSEAPKVWLVRASPEAARVEKYTNLSVLIHEYLRSGRPLGNNQIRDFFYFYASLFRRIVGGPRASSVS